MGRPQLLSEGRIYMWLREPASSSHLESIQGSESPWTPSVNTLPYGNHNHPGQGHVALAAGASGAGAMGPGVVVEVGAGAIPEGGGVQAQVSFDGACLLLLPANQPGVGRALRIRIDQPEMVSVRIDEPVGRTTCCGTGRNRGSIARTRRDYALDCRRRRLPDDRCALGFVGRGGGVVLVERWGHGFRPVGRRSNIRRCRCRRGAGRGIGWRMSSSK